MLLRSFRAVGRTAVRPVNRALSSVAANDDLSRFPKAQVTTLPNGVRVVTEQSSGSQVTIGAYVDSGSRHELDARTAGVANIATRLAASRGRAIESMGGSLTAWTTRESTSFRARVANKDVSQAVSLLGDLVKPQEFKSEELDVERAEALSDMISVDERADEVVFDRLHETAYRGTPLARPVLGTVTSVQSLTANDVSDYVKTHFTGGRIVVSASGAVDHRAVVDAVQAAFGGVAAKSDAAYLVPALFTGSEIRIRDDFLPRAHGIIAFPTTGSSDADQIPLLVAQQLVGTWNKTQWAGTNSTSDLVKQVSREKLADAVKTFNINYSDTGLFGVYFKQDWQGQHELCGEIMRTITQLSYDIDSIALHEAKQQAIMGVLAKYDNQDKTADEIARQVFAYGRRVHPAELVARINAVKASDVSSVAQRYFLDHDHAFTAYGPIYEMPDYNWIRSRTYWRRL